MYYKVRQMMAMTKIHTKRELNKENSLNVIAYLEIYLTKRYSVPKEGLFPNRLILNRHQFDTSLSLIP